MIVKSFCLSFQYKTALSSKTSLVTSKNFPVFASEYHLDTESTNQTQVSIMTFLYLGTHTKMESSANLDTDEKELGIFPEHSCCSLFLLYNQNDL